MNAGATAALFYLSVAALVGGTIRSVRSSVERRERDRAGIIVAAAGGLGLLAAIAAFALGPKDALPF
jgi:hypothetical protein